MATTVGKTGTIIQQIKLYIEGVQVPFDTIVINQGIGSLPSATISVPPQAGLMDIARFYQPKVHVFFEERVGPNENDTLEEAKRRDKLLFTGHIRGVQYIKNVQYLGNVSIVFDCAHKNTLITECLIDYTGWLKTELEQVEGAAKDGIQNSKTAIIEALQGIDFIGPDNEITPENPDGKTNVLPEKFSKFYTRYLGMPGVLLNYWNQLNRAAFNKNAKVFQQAFYKLYKPLIEDGLKFFDRIAGHTIVEEANQNGKVDPCIVTGTTSTRRIIIPPVNKIFLQSAIQTEMTISSLQSYLQASGEITNIFAIFQSFYEASDYEIITLASPAEIPVQENSATPVEANGEGTDEQVMGAVETIIKPKTPFYYSPTCNVLFPSMFSTVSVNYDEANIPTRVDMVNQEMPQGAAWGTHFRAPHTVRSAIAAIAAAIDSNNNNDLNATIHSSYGAIGIYEQGRGVKIEYSALPRWLAYLSNSSYSANGNNTQYYPDKNSDPISYQALQDLQAGWIKRYPNQKDLAMCPWSKESNISAHHRILFASADYYYSMLFARSKAGNVDCPFNPYIVPGYPMDILERSPILPSFHAMCTSVTHNLSASSISTTVSFAAANTYAELANYYIPFINPFLQVTLGLAKNPTLVNSDDEAKIKADEFYRSVLGVGVAVPEDIYDFNTGLTKPIKLDASRVWAEGSTESSTDSNGGELNPALTYEGNIDLVARPLENRFDYEERFGIKFIDLTPENYSPTAIRYSDPEGVRSSNQQLEIGASQFLKYDTKFGEPV